MPILEQKHIRVQTNRAIVTRFGLGLGDTHLTVRYEREADHGFYNLLHASDSAHSRGQITAKKNGSRHKYFA